MENSPVASTQPQPPVAADEHLAHAPAPSRRTSRTTVVLCVLAGVVLTLLIGVGIYYWYYFHGHISPTKLSEKEQVVLGEKLEVVTGTPVYIHPEGFEAAGRPSVIGGVDLGESPTPEEAAAGTVPGNIDLETASQDVFIDDDRTLVLSEREINGFLHHNTEYAERLKIELGTDTVTAKMIKEFPDETPMVGGRTLRVNVTVAAYLDAGGGLVVELRNVSAGGISIPNAWLGDMKNKNLIEFGDNSEGGAILDKISQGIADFKIENGQIRIRLNE